MVLKIWRRDVTGAAGPFSLVQLGRHFACMSQRGSIRGCRQECRHGTQESATSCVPSASYACSPGVFHQDQVVDVGVFAAIEKRAAVRRGREEGVHVATKSKRGACVLRKIDCVMIGAWMFHVFLPSFTWNVSRSMRPYVSVSSRNAGPARPADRQRRRLPVCAFRHRNDRGNRTDHLRP